MCIEFSDACKQDQNIMCVSDVACKDHRNLPKNEDERMRMTRSVDQTHTLYKHQ